MNELEELKKEYKTIKDQVDAIQIHIASHRTPWYKNIPVIISVVALIFSFGTTYVSNERIKSQDIQALKSELRGVLQQLSSIPFKHSEVSTKYSNDNRTLGTLTGSLNQEQNLLASHAAEIIKKLPLDKVTSIERYSVGLALVPSSLEQAIVLYKSAYDLAEDFSTAIAAKRGVATGYFSLGQPENGRRHFQEALGIFSKFPEYDESFINGVNVDTLIVWAKSEADFGYIDNAKTKFEEAYDIANTMGAGPEFDRLRSGLTNDINMLMRISRESGGQ